MNFKKAGKVVKTPWREFIQNITNTAVLVQPEMLQLRDACNALGNSCLLIKKPDASSSCAVSLDVPSIPGWLKSELPDTDILCGMEPRPCWVLLCVPLYGGSLGFVKKPPYSLWTLFSIFIIENFNRGKEV